MTLQIAHDLSLPIEFAGEASAILARRGRGKTYAASVLAEELFKAGQPFVVLDPVGVWWGLRSSADGTKPGLQVKIIGGENNDVPLDPAGGAQYATFVVDNPAAYVLDLSSIESKGGHDRFVAEFVERLYKYKSAMERRTPLTLIIDEADEFAPQTIRNKEGGYAPRMLGAIESIVRRGRARGIGCVMITQRPAVLNNNVLMQAGALLLLGMTGPADRTAIDLWIKGHAEEEERKQVIGSLAHLDVGEAWVWWPTEDLLQRTKIRSRRTFDSSSTPKAGDVRAQVTFADVDLDALKEAVASSIEKAKAEDPKLLQSRIRELEKELATARKVQPQPEPIIERVEVEVPVLSQEAVEALRGASGALHLTRDVLDAAMKAFATPGVQRSESPAPSSVRARPVAQPRPAPRPVAPSVGDGTVSGPMRKLLAVLATYGPRTKRQLAMQAGYSAKGGGFNNPLSALRSGGYVERGEPIVITQAGIDALGDFDPLPTGQALVDHWMGQLSGPERKILQPLIDCWPEAMSKEALADVAGYAPVGGGFNNPLSRLRTLELVTRGPDIALTDDFAEAIA